jgi:hypothetical protein
VGEWAGGRACGRVAAVAVLAVGQELLAAAASKLSSLKLDWRCGGFQHTAAAAAAAGNPSTRVLGHKQRSLPCASARYPAGVDAASRHEAGWRPRQSGTGPGAAADGTGNSASGSQALAWVLSLYSCCAAAIAHQSSSLAVGVAGWTAATLVLAMPGWQGRGMPGGTAQREAFFWRRRGCTGSSRQQPEAHACHCCEAHSSTMLLGPSAVAHSGQRLLPLLRVSLVAHGCGAGRVGLRVVCVAQQRLRLACVCARRGVWGAAGLCGL